MATESHPPAQPHFCEHPPGDLRSGCPNWPTCLPTVRPPQRVSIPLRFDTEPPDVTELDALKARFLAKHGGLYRVSTTPPALRDAVRALDNRRRRPWTHAISALGALIVIAFAAGVALGALAFFVWLAFHLAAAA